MRVGGVRGGGGGGKGGGLGGGEGGGGGGGGGGGCGDGGEGGGGGKGGGSGEGDGGGFGGYGGKGDWYTLISATVTERFRSPASLNVTYFEPGGSVDCTALFGCLRSCFETAFVQSVKNGPTPVTTCLIPPHRAAVLLVVSP